MMNGPPSDNGGVQTNVAPTLVWHMAQQQGIDGINANAKVGTTNMASYPTPVYQQQQQSTFEYATIGPPGLQSVMGYVDTSTGKMVAMQQQNIQQQYTQPVNAQLVQGFNTNPTQVIVGQTNIALPSIVGQDQTQIVSAVPQKASPVGSVTLISGQGQTVHVQPQPAVNIGSVGLVSPSGTVPANSMSVVVNQVAVATPIQPTTYTLQQHNIPSANHNPLPNQHILATTNGPDLTVSTSQTLPSISSIVRGHHVMQQPQQQLPNFPAQFSGQETGPSIVNVAQSDQWGFTNASVASAVGSLSQLTDVPNASRHMTNSICNSVSTNQSVMTMTQVTHSPLTSCVTVASPNSTPIMQYTQRSPHNRAGHDNRFTNHDHMSKSMNLPNDNRSELDIRLQDIESEGHVRKKRKGRHSPPMQINVPFGWKRVVEGITIVYYSASNVRLVNLEHIKQYLQTEGTCKCGLECPLLVEKVFNFDPGVISRQWTPEDVNNMDDVIDGLTKLCNHRRKIIAMATFQNNAVPQTLNDSPPKAKRKKGKKKARKSTPDNMLVSQILAQRSHFEDKIGPTSPKHRKLSQEDLPSSETIENQQSSPGCASAEQNHDTPAPAIIDPAAYVREHIEKSKQYVESQKRLKEQQQQQRNKDSVTMVTSTGELGPITCQIPPKLQFEQQSPRQPINSSSKIQSPTLQTIQSPPQHIMSPRPSTPHTLPSSQPVSPAMPHQMYQQQRPMPAPGPHPPFMGQYNNPNMNMQPHAANPNFNPYFQHQPDANIPMPMQGHGYGPGQFNPGYRMPQHSGQQPHRMPRHMHDMMMQQMHTGQPGPPHMMPKHTPPPIDPAMPPYMFDPSYNVPKQKPKRSRKKKSNSVLDRNSPCPNVDVRQMPDESKTVPLVPLSVVTSTMAQSHAPTPSSASFLENPTGFMAQQTALVNSSMTIMPQPSPHGALPDQDSKLEIDTINSNEDVDAQSKNDEAKTVSSDSPEKVIADTQSDKIGVSQLDNDDKSLKVSHTNTTNVPTLTVSTTMCTVSMSVPLTTSAATSALSITTHLLSPGSESTLSATSPGMLSPASKILSPASTAATVVTMTTMTVTASTSSTHSPLSSQHTTVTTDVHTTGTSIAMVTGSEATPMVSHPNMSQDMVHAMGNAHPGNTMMPRHPGMHGPYMGMPNNPSGGPMAPNHPQGFMGPAHPHGHMGTPPGFPMMPQPPSPPKKAGAKRKRSRSQQQPSQQQFQQQQMMMQQQQMMYGDNLMHPRMQMMQQGFPPPNGPPQQQMVPGPDGQMRPRGFQASHMLSAAAKAQGGPPPMIGPQNRHPRQRMMGPNHAMVDPMAGHPVNYQQMRMMQGQGMRMPPHMSPPGQMQMHPNMSPHMQNFHGPPQGFPNEQMMHASRHGAPYPQQMMQQGMRPMQGQKSHLPDAQQGMHVGQNQGHNPIQMVQNMITGLDGQTMMDHNSIIGSPSSVRRGRSLSVSSTCSNRSDRSGSSRLHCTTPSGSIDRVNTPSTPGGGRHTPVYAEDKFLGDMDSKLTHVVTQESKQYDESNQQPLKGSEHSEKQADNSESVNSEKTVESTLAEDKSTLHEKTNSQTQSNNSNATPVNSADNTIGTDVKEATSTVALPNAATQIDHSSVKPKKKSNRSKKSSTPTIASMLQAAVLPPNQHVPFNQQNVQQPPQQMMRMPQQQNMMMGQQHMMQQRFPMQQQPQSIQEQVRYPPPHIMVQTQQLIPQQGIIMNNQQHVGNQQQFMIQQNVNHMQPQGQFPPMQEQHMQQQLMQNPRMPQCLPGQQPTSPKQQGVHIQQQHVHVQHFPHPQPSLQPASIDGTGVNTQQVVAEDPQETDTSSKPEQTLPPSQDVQPNDSETPKPEISIPDDVPPNEHADVNKLQDKENVAVPFEKENESASPDEPKTGVNVSDVDKSNVESSDHGNIQEAKNDPTESSEVEIPATTCLSMTLVSPTKSVDVLGCQPVETKSMVMAVEAPVAVATFPTVSADNMILHQPVNIFSTNNMPQQINMLTGQNVNVELVQQLQQQIIQQTQQLVGQLNNPAIVAQLNPELLQQAGVHIPLEQLPQTVGNLSIQEQANLIQMNQALINQISQNLQGQLNMNILQQNGLQQRSSSVMVPSTMIQTSTVSLANPASEQPALDSVVAIQPNTTVPIPPDMLAQQATVTLPLEQVSGVAVTSTEIVPSPSKTELVQEAPEVASEFHKDIQEEESEEQQQSEEPIGDDHIGELADEPNEEEITDEIPHDNAPVETPKSMNDSLVDQEDHVKPEPVEDISVHSNEPEENVQEDQIDKQSTAGDFVEQTSEEVIGEEPLSELPEEINNTNEGVFEQETAEEETFLVENEEHQEKTLDLPKPIDNMSVNSTKQNDPKDQINEADHSIQQSAVTDGFIELGKSLHDRITEGIPIAMGACSDDFPEDLSIKKVVDVASRSEFTPNTSFGSAVSSCADDDFHGSENVEGLSIETRDPPGMQLEALVPTNISPAGSQKSMVSLTGMIDADTAINAARALGNTSTEDIENLSEELETTNNSSSHNSVESAVCDGHISDTENPPSQSNSTLLTMTNHVSPDAATNESIVLNTTARSMHLSGSTDSGTHNHDSDHSGSESTDTSSSADINLNSSSSPVCNELCGSREVKKSHDSGLAEDFDDDNPDSPFEPDPDYPRTFNIGDLVWGQIRGFPSWPGKLVHEVDVKNNKETPEDGKLWVKWFGDHTYTQVEPCKLKTLSEGLEAHHRARKKHRRGRKMNTNLEAAINEAMAELDRMTSVDDELDAKNKAGKKRKK
ncbi:unnamed protein product [Owenia fusiformis]|uniref:Uncharacterized protein n=1 Tax=Owenia fusiformis TaxID=6347 RepID=A0A8J1Y1N7_OWEFU|nr:unnamed protein product [Owenia fusiformis]